MPGLKSSGSEPGGSIKRGNHEKINHEPWKNKIFKIHLIAKEEVDESFVYLV